MRSERITSSRTTLLLPGEPRADEKSVRSRETSLLLRKARVFILFIFFSKNARVRKTMRKKEEAKSVFYELLVVETRVVFRVRLRFRLGSCTFST